jgi:transposase InsO family protein
MVDEIFMRHGSPEILVLDKGTAFVNKTLKQVCSLLKIRKITTAPYNPRADRLAENAVRTVKDMLSSYTNVLG